MNQNNSSIKNMTAYQATQALASMAQRTFNKNFKLVTRSNTTSSITNIGKYIDEQKNAVNNKVIIYDCYGSSSCEATGIHLYEISQHLV